MNLLRCWVVREKEVGTPAGIVVGVKEKSVCWQLS